MDRRRFLQRAAMIAAGAVAADQMELLDRLGWKRRFFPGWSSPERTWLTPPLEERAGLYRITKIESSFYLDRIATTTVELDGEAGGCGLVLDTANAAGHLKRFRVGDWVQLKGEWGDWPQLGQSLLSV